MPPRSRAAIWWEAIGSCLALPPGRAFIERAWPRTKGMASSAQRSARQVAGDEACNRHHQPVARGGNGLATGGWSGVHVAVQQDIPLLVHDPDRHAAGLQGDTAGKWGRLGIASPEVSSSCVRARVAQRQQTTRVCGGGGLNQYQSLAGDGFQPHLKRGVSGQPFHLTHRNLRYSFHDA